MTYHVTTYDMLYVPGDSFSVLVVFKKKNGREHKKTVGDVDQQMVQRGILNGVPESNVLTDLPELWKRYFHDVINSSRY